MITPGYKALYERAHFLHRLGRDLERVSAQMDLSRVIRLVLRRLGERLGADLTAQIDIRRADQSLERPYVLALTAAGRKLVAEAGGPPEGTAAFGSRFEETCRKFLARPIGPPDHRVLLLKVDDVDRPEAVLAFLRHGRDFSHAETLFAQEAAAILSESLRHRERERAQDLKERIYAKILSEIRPQDVLYQILHGLKRLLQYDHGAAVLLLNQDGSELAFQAEIIAWTKAKSERIGRRVALDAEARDWLAHAARPLLLRGGEPADGPTASLPASLCAALVEAGGETPPSRAMIVAVLRHRSRPLGILQVRSRSAAAFTTGDLRVLDEFLPLASLTLYNSTLYKAQHDLLVSAERRAALADLARAISHDLNNAFGVILPLLQTLRREIASGAAVPEQIARDVEVVEHYAHTSARIFQGLLSAARGVAEPARWTDLNAILDSILRMVGPNLEARRIRVVRELTPELPPLFVRRAEMEQVFLNLIGNAADAMPEGGDLTLRSAPEDGGVRVELIDTGIGIPEEIRKRIFEPFFTTKPSGSGLGLDISRSIIWDYDGRLDIDSEPGRGTRVLVRLPRLAERLRAAAEGRPARS